MTKGSKTSRQRSSGEDYEGMPAQKRARKGQEVEGSGDGASSGRGGRGGGGKQLRAIKPHDAAIEVLRSNAQGLTLDEILVLCQQLPRKLDLGNSRPGTSGMNARGIYTYEYLSTYVGINEFMELNMCVSLSFSFSLSLSLSLSTCVYIYVCVDIHI